MNNRNNNFFQTLPDIPWWAIVLGFMFFTPLGIGLLVCKILKDSHPNPQRWTQPPAQSQEAQTQPPAKRAQTRPRNTRTAGYNPARSFPYVKLKSGKGLTITGGIIAAVFALAVGTIFMEWGLDYPRYFLEDAFVPMVFTGAGIGMVLWGRFQASRTKKFKRYLARIGNEPLIPLRPLAESIPASMDEVCETLQQMIDTGVFGDRAYLDIAAETLVVDSSVARPAPVVKQTPSQPKEPDLSSEDKILQEIRYANDRIPGEEISRKIDRIEEITRHILNYLKKHPERSSELHTFLDYYLPTTLKMLNAYAELDAQQLDGENIAATKHRIEGILDKVVEGFELQLDKLFEGDMLDISSDIDVMEKMLQRDGLSGDMKMRKSVQAQAAQGYTPSLTLDPDQTGSATAEHPTARQSW